ncbi:MAG: DUF86 domain-containing protein [Candidatus Omnitrophica bacterium]|nr:DUF86 domain-containing protein [Candidatus Omnitrophota bacterium]
MGFVRKERIKEYLENINRQVEDLKNFSVPDKEFFQQRANVERTKAIKYSLACAIEDICHIALHISVALNLCKVRDSAAEAIVALGEGGILPKEFAQTIKQMPAFRNRLIHDYLPNEFDSERLWEALAHLEDFNKFSQYILDWLNKE